MKRISTAIAATVSYVVMFALMAPKAIGLALWDHFGKLTPATLGDGGATEMKALEKAVKDAMDAMQENIKKTQDLAAKAIEDVRQEGTLHAKTNEELKKLGETGNTLSTTVKGLTDRFTELEQKMTKRATEQPVQHKTLAEQVVDSDEFKAVLASKGKSLSMGPVTIGSFHKAAAIFNPTTSLTQNILVDSQRVAGIITPNQRRFTIRDLIPAAMTGSNLIEFARELTFVNAAAPQGQGSSPAETEGQVKAQSGMTFELAQVPVITIAHWIAASRQVLSDASQLAGHINGRLVYGLKLEEEDELLNSSGTSGELDGLIHQAAAFTGGGTNRTAIDTLLRAFTQISLSEYEASAVVLHPTDWMEIMLLKDTQGRYLFSDPQNMVDARIWAKPVVPTQSISQGTFLAGAFNLGAQIWDNEDANVRISENVDNHFLRNMVAILAEERLALAVYRPTAFVTGSLNTPG